MAKGWSLFKGDKANRCHLEKTKRNLLIGYDMISLRGLGATEKHLNKLGFSVSRAVAQIAEDGDGLVPVINGKIDPHVLQWATWPMDADKALYKAAFYFADQDWISESDRMFLRRFFYTPSTQIKRLKARGQKANAILASYGVALRPVKIVQLAPSRAEV